jgi:hypothetical protein
MIVEPCVKLGQISVNICTSTFPIGDCFHGGGHEVDISCDAEMRGAVVANSVIIAIIIAILITILATQIVVIIAFTIAISICKRLVLVPVPEV